MSRFEEGDRVPYDDEASIGSEAGGSVKLEPMVWTLEGKLKKLTEVVTDPSREAFFERIINCTPQAGWAFLVEFSTQYALMNEVETFDAHSFMTSKPIFQDYDKTKPNRKTTFEIFYFDPLNHIMGVRQIGRHSPVQMRNMIIYHRMLPNGNDPTTARYVTNVWFPIPLTQEQQATAVGDIRLWMRLVNEVCASSTISDYDAIRRADPSIVLNALHAEIVITVIQVPLRGKKKEEKEGSKREMKVSFDPDASRQAPVIGPDVDDAEDQAPFDFDTLIPNPPLKPVVRSDQFKSMISNSSRPVYDLEFQFDTKTECFVEVLIVPRGELEAHVDEIFPQLPESELRDRHQRLSKESTPSTTATSTSEPESFDLGDPADQVRMDRGKLKRDGAMSTLDGGDTMGSACSIASYGGPGNEGTIAVSVPEINSDRRGHGLQQIWKGGGQQRSLLHTAASEENVEAVRDEQVEESGRKTVANDNMINRSGDNWDVSVAPMDFDDTLSALTLHSDKLNAITGEVDVPLERTTGGQDDIKHTPDYNHKHTDDSSSTATGHASSLRGSVCCENRSNIGSVHSLRADDQNEIRIDIRATDWDKHMEWIASNWSKATRGQLVPVASHDPTRLRLHLPKPLSYKDLIVLRTITRFIPTTDVRNGVYLSCDGDYILPSTVFSPNKTAPQKGESTQETWAQRVMRGRTDSKEEDALSRMGSARTLTRSSMTDDTSSSDSTTPFDSLQVGEEIEGEPVPLPITTLCHPVGLSNWGPVMNQYSNKVALTISLIGDARFSTMIAPGDYAPGFSKLDEFGMLHGRHRPFRLRQLTHRSVKSEDDELSTDSSSERLPKAGYVLSSHSDDQYAQDVSQGIWGVEGEKDGCGGCLPRLAIIKFRNWKEPVVGNRMFFTFTYHDVIRTKLCFPDGESIQLELRMTAFVKPPKGFRKKRLTTTDNETFVPRSYDELDDASDVDLVARRHPITIADAIATMRVLAHVVVFFRHHTSPQNSVENINARIPKAWNKCKYKCTQITATQADTLTADIALNEGVIKGRGVGLTKLGGLTASESGSVDNDSDDEETPIDLELYRGATKERFNRWTERIRRLTITLERAFPAFNSPEVNSRGGIQLCLTMKQQQCLEKHGFNPDLITLAQLSEHSKVCKICPLPHDADLDIFSDTNGGYTFPVKIYREVGVRRSLYAAQECANTAVYAESVMWIRKYDSTAQRAAVRSLKVHIVAHLLFGWGVTPLTVLDQWLSESDCEMVRQAYELIYTPRAIFAIDQAERRFLPPGGSELDIAEQANTAPVVKQGVRRISDVCDNLDVSRIVQFRTMCSLIYATSNAHAETLKHFSSMRGGHVDMNLFPTRAQIHPQAVRWAWLQRSGAPTLTYEWKWIPNSILKGDKGPDGDRLGTAILSFRQSGFEQQPLLHQDPWPFTILWTAIANGKQLARGQALMSEMEVHLKFDDCPVCDYVSVSAGWSFFGTVRHGSEHAGLLGLQACTDPDPLQRWMALLRLGSLARSELVHQSYAKAAREASRYLNPQGTPMDVGDHSTCPECIRVSTSPKTQVANIRTPMSINMTSSSSTNTGDSNDKFDGTPSSDEPTSDARSYSDTSSDILSSPGARQKNVSPIDAYVDAIVSIVKDMTLLKGVKARLLKHCSYEFARDEETSFNLWGVWCANLQLNQRIMAEVGPIVHSYLTDYIRLHSSSDASKANEGEVDVDDEESPGDSVNGAYDLFVQYLNLSFSTLLYDPLYLGPIDQSGPGPVYSIICSPNANVRVTEYLPAHANKTPTRRTHTPALTSEPSDLLPPLNHLSHDNPNVGPTPSDGVVGQGSRCHSVSSPFRALGATTTRSPASDSSKRSHPYDSSPSEHRKRLPTPIPKPLENLIPSTPTTTSESDGSPLSRAPGTVGAKQAQLELSARVLFEAVPHFLSAQTHDLRVVGVNLGLRLLGTAWAWVRRATEGRALLENYDKAVRAYEDFDGSSDWSDERGWRSPALSLTAEAGDECGCSRTMVFKRDLPFSSGAGVRFLRQMVRSLYEHRGDGPIQMANCLVKADVDMAPYLLIMLVMRDAERCNWRVRLTNGPDSPNHANSEWQQRVDKLSKHKCLCSFAQVGSMPNAQAAVPTGRFCPCIFMCSETRRKYAALKVILNPFVLHANIPIVSNFAALRATVEAISESPRRWVHSCGGLALTCLLLVFTTHLCTIKTKILLKLFYPFQSRCNLEHRARIISLLEKCAVWVAEQTFCSVRSKNQRMSLLQECISRLREGEQADTVGG